MTYIKAKATITAYSSDGSIYSVAPHAVVPVNSNEDIISALITAKKDNLAVSVRGGGTGLSGGALGNGIVLDMSGYNKILDIDVSKRMVLTQPGVIYDELNIFLKKFSLFFPPDPSSGDSCQIGGMLANNSSGPRSVKYGLTSDFVEELAVIRPPGKLITLKKLRLDSTDLVTFLSKNPEYQKIHDILQRNKELILSRWPRVKKNSAGYNLRQVTENLGRGILNLPALYVGSEGTLGVFVSAKLSLLPIPTEILTARLYFKSLVKAGEAALDIQPLGPSGLEMVDGSTLDLIGRGKFKISPSAKALLLVEFDDDIESKRENLEDLSRKLSLETAVEFATDPVSTAELWRARKAIVPTLYKRHPKKRPLPLIEDVSIPPEHIPSFIEFATSIFDSHHLTYGIFGHIGDGNLHIRPLFDLNDPDDLKLATELYDKIYDKVIKIGGSTTAEHADGRLRAPLLRKLYGDEIYEIFRSIKHILDPDNILSPGVILSDDPFSKNIDYEKIKSYCAACGKCNGYCPAYDIFRREDFSPRGWLRMINQSGESRRQLQKYLSFCLNCKNCATVCPAGVDIASEIMKYRSISPSLLSRSVVPFTDIESFLSLSLKLGRLAAPLMESKSGKKLIGALGKIPFGFDSEINFPPIAKVKLRKRYPDRIADRGDVALFHGCADNLLESSVGDSIFKVFDKLGLKVYMPEQKCCGLPYEVYGHKDNLIKKAKFNIANLENFRAIITGCASCLLRLKEYKNLFEDDDLFRLRAEKIAKKCYDISQLLNLMNIDYSIFDNAETVGITYHNPCHLRAAGLHKEPEKLLSKLNNVRIIHPVYADRCCAQAGSYGFTHYQESKRMFEKKKEEYLSIDAEYLMTSCPACQMKIRTETGSRFKVVHPIEILAERLGNR